MRKIKTWIIRSKKIVIILMFIVIFYNIIASVFNLPVVPVDSVFGSVMSMLTVFGGL
ncbi:hypothetical protein FHW74_000107 [Atlantibacter sp. RC6]|nr:hypothetical protein [Atlantibacter sp. RC6]